MPVTFQALRAKLFWRDTRHEHGTPGKAVPQSSLCSHAVMCQ
jgi:hypothetical protein